MPFHLRAACVSSRLCRFTSSVVLLRCARRGARLLAAALPDGALRAGRWSPDFR